MTYAPNGWAKPIVIFIVLILLATGIYAWQARPSASHAAKPVPAVPVRVATVTRQNVAQYSSAIGSVEPLHRVVVRPQIDGQLTTLHVVEGQNVRVGDLLASLDDRAIQAALKLAEAEKRRAEAQLKSAELELARFHDLAKRQAIPRQQLEQQETLVAQMKAAVQSSEASIAAERVRLSHTRITSPLSGRIGLRHVDVGNFVRTADPEGLFTITQMHPISVVFSLPQQQLSQLRKLLRQDTAPVDAFERDGGAQLASGHLLMMDSIVDSSTGTVRLRAQFANVDEALWPGQWVKVRLQTGSHENSLAVPVSAVRMGLERSFVYRIRDEKAEVVPVKRIDDAGDFSVVEGVEAGDTIVVDGFTRLKDGISVKIVTATQTAVTSNESGKQVGSP